MRVVWERCNSRGRCRAIPRGRRTRHRVVRADLGMRLRVRVTAVRTGTAKTVRSPATRPVMTRTMLVNARRAAGLARLARR
ncbi:MAG: hypothetical protein RLN63_08240 [Miltoncostaeaceae bacterium]